MYISCFKKPTGKLKIFRNFFHYFIDLANHRDDNIKSLLNTLPTKNGKFGFCMHCVNLTTEIFVQLKNIAENKSERNPHLSQYFSLVYLFSCFYIYLK